MGFVNTSVNWNVSQSLYEMLGFNLSAAFSGEVNYTITGTAQNGVNIVSSNGAPTYPVAGQNNNAPLSGTQAIFDPTYQNANYMDAIYAGTGGTGLNFTITLLPGLGYAVDPTHASVTVNMTNDTYVPPYAPAGIAVSYRAAAAGENVVFTLTPASGITTKTQVNFNLDTFAGDDTATPGKDFADVSGSYWVYPGQPTVINVPTMNSADFNGGMLFFIAAINGVDCAGDAVGFIFPRKAFLTIYNNDGITNSVVSNYLATPNPQGLVDVGQCVPMIAELNPGDTQTTGYSLNYNTADFTVTTDAAGKNVVPPGSADVLVRRRSVVSLGRKADRPREYHLGQSKLAAASRHRACRSGSTVPNNHSR